MAQSRPVNGKASEWSRRDFVKRAFAAGVATMALGCLPCQSQTVTCRVALLGADPYGRRVLRSLLHLPNTELVALWHDDQRHLLMAAERVEQIAYSTPRAYVDHLELLNREHVDLVIVAAPNGEHGTQIAAAMTHASHVLIVQPVCRTINGLGHLTSAQLRRGRFVQVGREIRLVPELVSLSELVQDRLSVTNARPTSSASLQGRARDGRVFSEWAVWVEHLV
jgi:predicted dehydrogenase